MCPYISHGFTEEKPPKFAKFSFRLLVTGIASYFIIFIISGITIPEGEMSATKLDWYVELSMIIGLLLHGPGFVIGVLSFMRNEGSTLRKYLGLGGNAILMIFAAYMLLR